MKEYLQLNKDQISAIKSMNRYWEEVNHRDRETDNKDEIYFHELQQVVRKLGCETILAIIAHYANNYQPTEI
jgi:hypothetical protein